jgi:hypothetical protein
VNGEPWEGRWIRAGHPIFSGDGQRIAAGVEDEAGGTIAVDGETWWTRFAYAPQLPMFSGDGNRLAFEMWSRRGYTVYVNEERWPDYYAEIGILTFGPGSASLATDVRLADRSQTLVVDGTPWPRTFQSCWIPVFSPDGKRIATTISDKDGETVAVDGVCWTERFDDAKYCSFSPDGANVVASVRRGDKWTVAVNGVTWPDWYGSEVWWPFYTPDGRHVVAKLWKYQEPSPVYVDGERWRPEFLDIGTLSINPVTAELAAAVRDEKGWSVAEADRVWKARFEEIETTLYNPDGHHLAAIVRDSQGWTVAIDGETTPLRYGGGFFGGSEPKPERWGWDPSTPSLWILERDAEGNRARTEIDVG